MRASLAPLPDTLAPDPSTERQRGSAVGGVGLVLLIAAAAVAANTLSRAGGGGGGGDLTLPQRILFGAGLIPVVGLSLAAHEAGHLLGGRGAGFRFALFVLGPLRLSRAPGGIRPGLNRNPALYGGGAVSAPGRMSRDLRRGFRWTVAGGPLASLVGGLAALAAYRAAGLDAVSPASHGLPAYFASVAVLAFAGTSLLTAAVTLLPTSLGGLPSDGARFLRLSRANATARELALMALQARSVAGERPRDCDTALLAQALEGPDTGPEAASARFLAYRAALDRGDVETAREHLGGALLLLDGVPRAHRSAFALEAAYFEAAHRGDPQAGRRWLERASGGVLLDPHLRPRAEAAIRAADGDVAGAREAASRALSLLDDALDRGSVPAHREELLALAR